jgi:hypothetical protein
MPGYAFEVSGGHIVKQSEDVRRLCRRFEHGLFPGQSAEI